jgi:phospholipid transport system substrate-binding protein
MHKFIISFIVLIFSYGSVATNHDGPMDEFVRKLIDNSFEILRDQSLEQNQKTQKVEELISVNMDLSWMSKFVLGRYRRSLTSSQIESFTQIYSDYVVKTYSSAVKGYNDEEIKIQSKVSISEAEFAIKTQLLRKNLDPVNVDYLVRKLDDGTFKVFDIVTEGISLINSHQAEFANIISNSGYDALIAEIKYKIIKLTSK